MHRDTARGLLNRPPGGTDAPMTREEIMQRGIIVQRTGQRLDWPCSSLLQSFVHPNTHTDLPAASSNFPTFTTFVPAQIGGSQRMVPLCDGRFRVWGDEETVEVRPGELGVSWSAAKIVQQLLPGSQAVACGIRVGWQLLAVNGQSPEEELLAWLASGRHPYQMTFVKRFPDPIGQETQVTSDRKEFMAAYKTSYAVVTKKHFYDGRTIFLRTRGHQGSITDVNFDTCTVKLEGASAWVPMRALQDNFLDGPPHYSVKQMTRDARQGFLHWGDEFRGLDYGDGWIHVELEAPKRHLLRGITLEAADDFLKSVGFPDRYKRSAEDNERNGMLEKKVAATGYDLVRHIRNVWVMMRYTNWSVVEVLEAAGYPFHVDLSPWCFISHVQSETWKKTRWGMIQAGRSKTTLFYWMFQPWTLRAPRTIPMWIDYFSLRQCQNDFRPKPMAGVIETIGHTIIFNFPMKDPSRCCYCPCFLPEMAGRIWCLFELDITLRSGCRLSTVCTNVSRDLVEGIRSRFEAPDLLQAATSTNADAKREIQERIDQMPGGKRLFNERVVQFLLHGPDLQKQILFWVIVVAFTGFNGILFYRQYDNGRDAPAPEFRWILHQLIHGGMCTMSGVSFLCISCVLTSTWRRRAMPTHPENAMMAAASAFLVLTAVAALEAIMAWDWFVLGPIIYGDEVPDISWRLSWFIFSAPIHLWLIGAVIGLGSAVQAACCGLSEPAANHGPLETVQRAADAE